MKKQTYDLEAKEDLDLKYRLKAEGYDFDKVVDRVSDLRV